MIYELGQRRPVFEGSGHFIADSATIIGNVRLGDRASVWFNSVLRGDHEWIEIGASSNVQDGSVLHTDPGIDLVVGEFVTVGHKVMLHGCSIGDNTLIGIGSTVLNNARIGTNCIVGANSLVTERKVFPDGVLIMGSPAKVVRELNEEEISMNRAAAKGYVENARHYSSSLRECEPQSE